MVDGAEGEFGYTGLDRECGALVVHGWRFDPCEPQTL